MSSLNIPELPYMLIKYRHSIDVLTQNQFYFSKNFNVKETEYFDSLVPFCQHSIPTVYLNNWSISLIDFKKPNKNS